MKKVIVSLFFLTLTAYSIAAKNNIPKGPGEFLGNWFASDGSNALLISVLDSNIIYQNNVWKYSITKADKNTLTFKLFSNDKEKIISLFKKGAAYFVEDAKNAPQLLSKTKTRINGKTKEELKTEHLFDKNDSTVYKGFLKDYSEKDNYHTGQVFVNDLLTNKQEVYLINIYPDGSFYAKFPLSYAQDILVNFPAKRLFQACSFRIYCEPGKELFQFFDLSKKSPQQSVPPSEFMGEMAADNNMLAKSRFLGEFISYTLPKVINYKTFFYNLATDKLTELARLKDSLQLSDKITSIVANDIKFQVASLLFDYLKSPDNKNEGDTIFLSTYLKKLSLNDPSNLTSIKYKQLINIVQYSGLGKKEPKDLQKVLLYIKSNISFNTVNDNEDFIAFYIKYPEHHTEINSISTEYTWMKNIALIKETFKIEDGMALDLMKTQCYLQLLEELPIPFSDKRLQNIRNNLTNVILYEKILEANNSLKNNLAKISALSLNAINAEYRGILNNIIKKYAGKVIFLDFWATWCGPCLDGIDRIAPLKKELASQNVVFVHITNETSPLDAYNYRIASIAGEHYRLSANEWNRISNEFKISSIPHYVLINKDGTVENADYKADQNDLIKIKIQELIDKKF